MFMWYLLKTAGSYLATFCKAAGLLFWVSYQHSIAVQSKSVFRSSPPLKSTAWISSNRYKFIKACFKVYQKSV